eukprot:4861108-Amphidinium_carterae.3
MMQASYIKFHPTTGYHRATTEIRGFYDGFQIYNFNDKYNPQRSIDDSESNPTTLQQLLSISYYYAPNFSDALKDQKLNNLRHQGWEEPQIQMHEEALRKEKIMELYIILPEIALDMWIQHGCLPGSFIELDRRETRLYAINDFINLYLYNYPMDYPQQGLQLTRQNYYLTVVHTTERILTVLQEELRPTQGRNAHRYKRKTWDLQY